MRVQWQSLLRECSRQAGKGVEENRSEKASNLNKGVILGKVPRKTVSSQFHRWLWSLRYITELLPLRLQSYEKWPGGCVLEGHALKKEVRWCWIGKHIQESVLAPRNSEIGSRGPGWSTYTGIIHSDIFAGQFSIRFYQALKDTTGRGPIFMFASQFEDSLIPCGSLFWKVQAKETDFSF